MNIEIPQDLADKLQKRVDQSDEFSSVNDYIIYVLKQVASKLEAQNKQYDKSDEQKVQERLRGLGYVE